MIEIEYYLLQGKRRIRKYIKVKTTNKVIALKTFREWFKAKFKCSQYELILTQVIN